MKKNYAVHPRVPPGILVLVLCVLGFLFAGPCALQAGPSCCQLTADTAWSTNGYSSPARVAVDTARQRVYVADYGTADGGQIVSYSYEGVPKATLTVPSISGVAVGPWPRYDLYASTYSGLILRFDFGVFSKKTQLFAYEYAFRDLKVDADGTVFTVTENNVMALAGSPVTLAASTAVELNAPEGLWVEGHDVYVPDTYSADGRILKYPYTPGASPSFGSPTTVATLQWAESIWHGFSGRFYVTWGLQKYSIFDSAWNLEDTCNQVELYGVQGVGTDEYGAVYLASPEIHQVLKMDPCGLFPHPTATPPSQPTYLGADPPGTDKTFVYPSPLRGGQARVCYTMAEAGQAELTVWNEKAEKILSTSDRKPSGVQVTLFDCSGFGQGVYYYRLVLRYDSGRTVKTPADKFVRLR